MFKFPLIPDIDGLHPLVIHFPIALLLVAPILILIGLFYRSKSESFYLSGFIIMLLGLSGMILAVVSGEAAGELVERTPQISEVLGKHSDLAESTLTFFIIITIVYALFLQLPRIFKTKLKSKFVILIQIVYLIAYSFGCLMVANTAHLGGYLVHGLGVKAMINFEPTTAKPLKIEAVPKDTLKKENEIQKDSDKH